MIRPELAFALLHPAVLLGEHPGGIRRQVRRPRLPVL